MNNANFNEDRGLITFPSQIELSRVLEQWIEKAKWVEAQSLVWWATPYKVLLGADERNKSGSLCRAAGCGILYITCYYCTRCFTEPIADLIELLFAFNILWLPRRLLFLLTYMQEVRIAWYWYGSIPVLQHLWTVKPMYFFITLLVIPACLKGLGRLQNFKKSIFLLI